MPAGAQFTVAVAADTTVLSAATAAGDAAARQAVREATAIHRRRDQRWLRGISREAKTVECSYW
jgi:hypothetical protein